MDPLFLGALVAIITIVVLFSGVSVAIGLLIVSAGFLITFDGLRSLELMPEILFGKLDSFALLSIPMFIIMGSSIASTRAGADLYEALERWLTRVPGGLVISNLGACALFAAMSGSSPATCAAIGKMGIPEMRKRGYPDGVAAGSIAAGGTLGILIPPVRHNDCLWDCDRNIYWTFVFSRCLSWIASCGSVHGMVFVFYMEIRKHKNFVTSLILLAGTL
jgi:TRAP-type mannitol/chloroaromatic compound transport system permease large subunit